MKQTTVKILPLATLLLAGLISGCGGDRGATSSNGRTEFADIDAFVNSRSARRSHKNKVVFIGIDGAAWHFIDPLIAAGVLPNLARMKAGGASGILRSVPVYMSPPAWATMFTGYLPERNGVYAFGNWDPIAKEFLNVNALDLHVPQVWDVASYAGRKVAIVNVPMTFPAHEVNGLMVTGLMTPVEGTERIQLGPSASRQVAPDQHVTSHSPVRSVALDNDYNTFLFSLYDTMNDGAVNYDLASVVVLSKAPDHEGEHLGSYKFKVEQFSPWIRIHADRDGHIEDAWCKIQIRGGGEIGFSRAFFAIDAPYTYPDTLADVLTRRTGYYLPSIFMPSDIIGHITELSADNARYFYELDDWDLFCYVFTQSDNVHHVEGFGDRAVEVYRIIDHFVGELMHELPDDATLIVASDHGFGEYEWGIDLNQYFASIGLLRWQDAGVVDFDNTVVFHNLWHLYFNYDLVTRDELARRGLDVPPSTDPVRFLEDYLIEATRRIEAHGRAFPVSIERMPEGAVGRVPDMFVHGTYEGYGVDHWNLKEPHPEVVRRMAGTDQWWHIRDGVLLVWGNAARPGDLGVADIQDVAPTILSLLGLPIAKDMDGTVIRGALDQEVLSRGQSIVPDYAPVVAARKAMEVDREDLEKKLRSLGYIR